MSLGTDRSDGTDMFDFSRRNGQSFLRFLNFPFPLLVCEGICNSSIMYRLQVEMSSVSSVPTSSVRRSLASARLKEKLFWDLLIKTSDIEIIKNLIKGSTRRNEI